jgi:hypothetical protein
MALWTPAEITTALWLDAADSSTLFDATTGGSLVTADGAVARWEDKSGNGRHATQSTIGFRPLRKSAILGGKDVLRFDGVDDLMAIPAFSATAGISCFAVFVSRRTTQNRDGGIVFASSQNASSDHFGGAPGQAGTWFSSFFSTSRPMLSATNFTVPGTPYLTQETQTGTAIQGRVNAVTQLTPAATFNGSPDTFLIAFSKFTSVVYFANKDYCEVVFVQSPTTDTQQLLEGSLMWKWGLQSNLPANHPYKNAAPEKAGGGIIPILRQHYAAMGAR